MAVNFSLNDLFFLMPLIVLLFGSLLLLLCDCFTTFKCSFSLTILTFIGAMIALVFAPKTENLLLTAWLKSDFLSFIFTWAFLIVGLSVAFFGSTFFKKFQEAAETEFYFLLIASVFGLVLIGAAADFLTLFLGLETLSIALYILCGYMKGWSISHEAAIKYFLIGSLGTAFFLYGIALIYGGTGTTNLDKLLPAYLAITAPTESMLFLGGVVFLTFGLAFKGTLVPFHSWAPDVYEGASTPVVAFSAVGSKIGVFAAFIRIFLEALPKFYPLWNDSIAILSIISLIYANILAIRQTNLRRFFAYSGISHAGYLLIPVAASTPESISAIIFYLIVYACATFGAFSIISILDKENEGVELNDLKGLATRSPFLAAVFIVSLLTLAGIPPTAGFFAKFYIFKTGIDAGYYGLVAVGLLVTAISAYYYLRMVSYILSVGEKGEVEVLRFNASAVVGLASLMGIILLSLFPSFVRIF